MHHLVVLSGPWWFPGRAVRKGEETMPSSYADCVRDWESLLEAVRENQDQLSTVDGK